MFTREQEGPNQLNVIKQGKKIWEGPTGWFRITIPFGNTYDKQFLKDVLSKRITPLVLWPIAWETNGNIVTFYVDDFAVAEKLLSVDNTFEMPDGFKLKIKVNNGTPNVDINDMFKETIKVVMAKRYNAPNKALDLTNFHKDPMLQDYFCALSKPTVLLAAIEIIEKHIPDLEALNLNDNKINKLMFLKRYNTKFKNVKVLHLAGNKVEDLETLDALAGMPLIELLLIGNPICDTLKDQCTYIREIRLRFPKIMKLDGVELPPPIGFDLAEVQTLPPPIQTFLCNSDSGIIIRQFLEQYFRLFDTDNRQLLAEAYHERAIFSLTTNKQQSTEDLHGNHTNWYATCDRNILKVTNSERSFELLKKGKESIITFLSEMPMSRHDIMGFSVDLNVHTSAMMSLTVAGIFKELGNVYMDAPIRSFFKTMIIVPAGSGYCISNEELHITNATKQQIQTFELRHPDPVCSISSNLLEHAPDQVSEVDVNRYQLVEALSKHSRMNWEWSTKCLQETEWDLEKAILLFNEVNVRKGVPVEAFIE